jgi:hypothetical protein
MNGKEPCKPRARKERRRRRILQNGAILSHMLCSVKRKEGSGSDNFCYQAIALIERGYRPPERLQATTNAAWVSGIPILYLWCNTPASGVRLMPS